MSQLSAGTRFRQAVKESNPLAVVGCVNAYFARLATQSGFKAVYLSGGGVAACSCGIPDLGITTMEDVLIDARRITDNVDTPLLVDIDVGWGGAFNIARTIRNFERAGVAAVHIEDQVAQKRCGHRPNKAIVSKDEMVDRIKAAVDARVDENFVIMARTDALAVEGLDAAIERAQACVEAGADMIFPEAMTDLAMYRQFADAVKVPVLANITEFGATPLYTPRELEHQLKDSGATTIVVLENFANTLELVLPRTQIKHVIVASVGEMFGMIKGALLNFVIRKVKKMVPEYRIPNTITFQTALKQGAANTFKPVELTRDDTALLQYTGGTTGLAKGAVLSHGNICANMLQAKEWIRNSLREGEETVIAALPLYHIFALLLPYF